MHKKLKTVIATALAALISSAIQPALALAMPTEILIIRHGEKPASGPDLSDQGWERARALPQLFQRPEFQKFGPPAALYGFGPDKQDGAMRGIETLQFVGQAFGLPVISSFLRGQEQDLVQAIQNDSSLNGKFVVICWEHHSMTPLAADFGVNPAPTYPGDRFDRAWLLTFNGNQLASFQDLPQHLMPGDTEN
jgi:hypothetical protein